MMPPIKEEYKAEEEESKTETSATNDSSDKPSQSPSMVMEIPPQIDVDPLEGLDERSVPANELCRMFIKRGKCTSDPATWPSIRNLMWRNGEDASRDVVTYFS